MRREWTVEQREFLATRKKEGVPLATAREEYGAR